MKQKILSLALGLCLAAPLAADVGLSVSLDSREHLTVFTRDAIWNKEPQPSFRDTLLVLSSFQPNRREFLLFGNIIRGENVAIENGIWETRKSTLGMGIGKVLTAPLALRRLALDLALDFSAGPFVYFFLQNRYTFVSGRYNRDVEKASILKRVQYGLYATARLRLVRFKKYFEPIDLNLGLHFFMPFSNHEFNADTRARYHLFKTFVCAGFSF